LFNFLPPSLRLLFSDLLLGRRLRFGARLERDVEEKKYRLRRKAIVRDAEVAFRALVRPEQGNRADEIISVLKFSCSFIRAFA